MICNVVPLSVEMLRICLLRVIYLEYVLRYRNIRTSRNSVFDEHGNFDENLQSNPLVLAYVIWLHTEPLMQLAVDEILHRSSSAS